MIRLSVSIRSLLLFLSFALFGAQAAMAQCDITPQSSLEGCEPYDWKAVAKNTSGKTVTFYEWSWGDGNGSSGTTLSSTDHLYKSRGQYQVTLILTFADGTKCTTALASKVNVYGAPTA